jgi:membrane protease YdiL (CAAX protease family)
MNSFDQPPQESQAVTPALEPVPAPPLPDPYAAFTPDLRVPWTGADLWIFLVIYIGINFVLGIIVLIGGAAVIHKPFTDLTKDPVAFPVIAVITQVIISIATILYFWILVRIKRPQSSAQPREGYWRTMGFRPLGPAGTTFGRVLLCLLAGTVVSVAVAFSSSLMGKQPPTSMDALFQTRLALVLLMCFGVLVAPLVEEMMFRGFIYPVVARRFGIIASVLFTGILFGSFHALQLWPAKGLILLLMGVGVVFTWVRARAQTVVASLLMHIAYNGTIFAALLYQTKWLTDFSHIH